MVKSLIALIKSSLLVQFNSGGNDKGSRKESLSFSYMRGVEYFIKDKVVTLAENRFLYS